MSRFMSSIPVNHRSFLGSEFYVASCIKKEYYQRKEITFTMFIFLENKFKCPFEAFFLTFLIIFQMIISLRKKYLFTEWHIPCCLLPVPQMRNRKASTPVILGTGRGGYICTQCFTVACRTRLPLQWMCL